VTKPRLSIIVGTYNWPDALRLCLNSLGSQSNRDFEIIVADDGSGSQTAELISRVSGTLPMNIRHVWQEDIGFRKSLILNVAIREARGGYLIFLDGDCIAQPDFVARHLELAQPGCLVTGSRIMLGKTLTKELLLHEKLDFGLFLRKAPAYRLRNQISKLLPLFLRAPNTGFRDYRSFIWRRIKGCNLACWREDALRIGGFDEGLTGWGHEDADFVLRLHEIGVVRRSGAWATEILHLWHPDADRSLEESNRRIVSERIAAVKERLARTSGQKAPVTRSPPDPRP